MVIEKVRAVLVLGGCQGEPATVDTLVGVRGRGGLRGAGEVEVVDVTIMVIQEHLVEEVAVPIPLQQQVEDSVFLAKE